MKKFYLSIFLMVMTVVNMAAISSDVLYIVGNKMPGKWTWGEASTMTKVSDNVFTYTGEFEATTEKNGFQFMTSASWGNVNRVVPTAGIETISTGTYQVKQSDASCKDDVFNLSQAGNYKVTVDLNTMTMTVEKITKVYEHLYLMGRAGKGSFGTRDSDCIELTRTAENVFNYTGQLVYDSSKTQAGEFLFLLNTTGTTNDWAGVQYVLSTAANEVRTDIVNDGTYGIIITTKTNNQYFRVNETANWSITVDFNTMTLTSKLAGDSGIDAVDADNTPAEYYNLQGVRVAAPSHGLYLKKQGAKTTKVVM